MTSTAEEPAISPLFHYAYKQEGVVLDQQYNYQGNMLAVCNSNGEILFYSAQSEQQNREPLFTNDLKKINEKKNSAILKIAWSLPIFGLFASASISREIDLFVCQKSTLKQQICRRMEYIPLSLVFCPIESEVLLAVGLSDGSINILNEKLESIASVEAHEEAINSLAWDHKILAYEKNKWIKDNFSHVRRITGLDEPPLMVSGSSDLWIKLWRWQNGKLIELYRHKAHQKPIREVQWRPAYLLDSELFIITCSQDCTVRIWKLKEKDQKIELVPYETKPFGGPVYKANFNFLGNMIAISYCNEAEERVETVIMKEKNGMLMGEQIKIQV